MYLSMPVILLAIAVIALLGWLAFFRRSGDRDLMGPPPSYRSRPSEGGLGRQPFPPGGGLPLDVETEARKLIEQGQLINAIKLVRERTSMSLKEAKEAVDALR